jgi:16S rRNA (uracil1498-N3)-methyltransferase
VYDGIIKETKTREVLITITGERPDKKNRGELITLVQAIPKKDKMDYIVEKSTELGVGRIIPVVTQRTIVRMDDSKAGVRVSRWRHLALEAAKTMRAD